MEHGIFHIAQKPNFLNIKLLGSFNQEGTLAFVKAMKAAIIEFNNLKFTLLFDITEFDGATPEAYKEVELYNLWLNNQKMVAKATVIRSRVQISIVNLLSPARQQQNTQNFYHYDEAEHWLTQELTKSDSFQG